MGLMKVVRKNVTELSTVTFGEMEFTRIKNYNSNDGLTRVIWQYKSDKVTIEDVYSKRLEKRYLRLQRKKSKISK